jgi:deazaflavin-dependent oxidoreductase (nitroreductase family)
MPSTYDQPGVVRRAILATGKSARFARLYAVTMHRLDHAVYRLTRGRVIFSAVLTGLPVVLLKTTGAKSGQPRTWPLIGLRDEQGKVAVVASNYGNQRHPAWAHNLRANPNAHLIADGAVTPVVAHEALGAERQSIWRNGLTIYPAWEQYARRAAPRQIPIFVLTPAQDRSPTSLRPQ